MDTYKVYIKIDLNNYVIAINSRGFLTDTTDLILIDEGTGDKYHHAQGNYLDKPLFGDNGCHNYIYKNEVVRETTDEEKQAELASFPKPEPTVQEDVMSMLVDTEYRLTLLETGVQ